MKNGRGIVPGIIRGIVSGIAPGIVPGIVPSIVPGIVPGIVRELSLCLFSWASYTYFNLLFWTKCTLRLIDL